MRRDIKMGLIFISTLLLSFTALAAPPLEGELEARAKDVGHALRCVVCQNQSIEESEASLAEDMRRLVRTRISAGDTNDEVIHFMRERYGDYVLLKPPVNTKTYILWFAPFALIALGLIWYGVRSCRYNVDAIKPLSPDESETLKRLLGDNTPS